MKGWHNESQRHSLAARGIRSVGIENPYITRSELTELVYGDRKYEREYMGSGVEGIEPGDITEHAFEITKYMNKKSFDSSNHYYEFLGRVTDSVWRNAFSSDTIADDDIYNAINEIFSRNLIKIKSIHVYGSRVTGYYRPLSDIDVAVIIEENKDLMDLIGSVWPDSDASFLKLLFFSVNSALIEMYGRPSDVISIDNEKNEIEIDVTMSLEDIDPLHPSIEIWKAE